MSHIKERRLTLELESRPGLRVGACVPFYWCPRSVMLFVIYRGNSPDLTYGGGQGPVVHLEADLFSAVKWAEEAGKRWAFTLTSAGSRHFEDRCNLDELDALNWAAIAATDWRDPLVKEGKQAEFLMEAEFPWELVDRIGVYSLAQAYQVHARLSVASHRPRVEILRDWYY